MSVFVEEQLNIDCWINKSTKSQSLLASMVETSWLRFDQFDFCFFFFSSWLTWHFFVHGLWSPVTCQCHSDHNLNGDVIPFNKKQLSSRGARCVCYILKSWIFLVVVWLWFFAFHKWGSCDPLPLPQLLCVGLLLPALLWRFLHVHVCKYHDPNEDSYGGQGSKVTYLDTKPLPAAHFSASFDDFRMFKLGL